MNVLCCMLVSYFLLIGYTRCKVIKFVYSLISLFFQIVEDLEYEKLPLRCMKIKLTKQRR